MSTLTKFVRFGGADVIFCNRQRDKLKVLYWDKTGFCL
ncbi:MAG: transposase [Aliidiomarina sp.]|nr:transposase [Aliidiomarina sp.]